MQNVFGKIKMFVLSALVMSFMLTPVFVLADNAQDLKNIKDSNYGAGTVHDNSLLKSIGISQSNPEALAQVIVRVILGFVGIVLFILFFYAGFVWIKSRDNASEVDKARSIIESALIGAVITMAAFAISEFVFSRLIEVAK